MKKLLLLAIALISLTATTAQTRKPKGKLKIIRRDVIKNYYEKQELEALTKKELIPLYKRRVVFLMKILPYIAFSSDPNFALESTGISDIEKTKKSMQKQFKITDEFLLDSNSFQNEILPYSNTKDLVKSILFLESFIKSLHTYEEN